MATIAVKIVDPADQQWAQLLDATAPIHRLLPPLVERLGLPETPNYELVDRRDDHILPAADSLSDAGIAGGEELLLRPVRDGILADFLDALYEEALGFAAEQAFDKAITGLETLYRLDPAYPDRQNLWRKVAQGGAKSGGSHLDTGARSSSGHAPSPSRPRTVSRKSQSRSSRSRGAADAARPASKSSGLGCSLIVLVLTVLVFVFVWMTGRLDEFGMPPWPFDVPTTTAPISPRADEPLLGTGDVQITLRWDNDADLDLHVVDPDGSEIYYGNRSVPSGGQLDVDAQGGCGGEAPVENVFWPTGGAPRGSYAVQVVHFKTCTSSATSSYTVTVRVDGRVVDEQQGRIAPGAPPVDVARFTR